MPAWEDAPLAEEEKLSGNAWEDAPLAEEPAVEPAPEKNSFLKDGGHSAAYYGKLGAQGIASLADIPRFVNSVTIGPLMAGIGELTGADWMKEAAKKGEQVPTVSQHMGNLADSLYGEKLVPRNNIEKYGGAAVQAIAPGGILKGPMAIKSGTELLSSGLAGLGSQATSDIQQSQMALPEEERSTFLKYAAPFLPYVAGMLPAAMEASYRGGARGFGKAVGSDAQKVEELKAVGAPLSAPAVSDSGRLRGATNLMSQLPGGRALRETAEEATDVITKGLKEGAPDATPQQAGNQLRGEYSRKLDALNQKGAAYDAQLQGLAEGTTIEPDAIRKKIVEIVGDPAKVGETNVKIAMQRPEVKYLQDLINDPAFRDLPEGVMQTRESYGNALDSLTSERQGLASTLEKVKAELTNTDPYMNAAKHNELREAAKELSQRLQRQDGLIGNTQATLGKIENQIAEAPIKIPLTGLQKAKENIADALPSSEFVQNQKTGVTRRAMGAVEEQRDELLDLLPEDAQNIAELRRQKFRTEKTLRKDAKDGILGEQVELRGEPLYKKGGAPVFNDAFAMLKSDPEKYQKFVQPYIRGKDRDAFRAAANLEMAGGNDFSLDKWRSSYKDLMPESQQQLVAGRPTLKPKYEALAKAIDNYKGNVGFDTKKSSQLLQTIGNTGGFISGVATIIGGPIMGAPAASFWLTNKTFSKLMTNPEFVELMAGTIKMLDNPLPIGKAAILQSAQRVIQNDTNLDSEEKAAALEAIQKDFEAAPLPESDEIKGGGSVDELKGGNEKVLWEKRLTPPEKKKPVTAGHLLDIEAEEGLRLKPYKDTRGKTTVGIGFNMDNPSARKIWGEAGIKAPFQAVKQGRQALTEAEAKKLAAKSYEIAQNDTKRLYPNFNKLSKNRQAALTNLSYQLGGNKLAEFDKANRAIRNGRFDVAAKHLAMSAWAKQTPERAKRIIAMLKEDKPYGKQS